MLVSLRYMAHLRLYLALLPCKLMQRNGESMSGWKILLLVLLGAGSGFVRCCTTSRSPY